MTLDSLLSKAAASAALAEKSGPPRQAALARGRSGNWKAVKADLSIVKQ